MLRKLLFLSMFFSFAAASLTAKADTIGPGSSCASCFGDSYTLSYTTVSPNVFDVTLVINGTGFNGTAGDLLSDVSLKISSNNPAVTLLSAPTGYSTVRAGGLNAGGCDGHGSGFFCSPYTGSGYGLQLDKSADIYTFVWQVTDSSGNLLTDVADNDDDDASVKALYVTSTGKQNGITSENITLSPGTPVSPVPEPSSIVLLGTGLLSAAGLVRRKFFA